MPNNNFTLCFSGHRSFSDDGSDALAAAVVQAYADGYRVFVSGMAAGFDLAAAEAVLRLRGSCEGVQLVCAVPFAGQARDFSPADRRRYDTVLGLADEVRTLSERWSAGVYYRRNEWMVERSSRLICWYDAATAEQSSGTRHTVRTALRGGLAIVNLFQPANSLFSTING